jgi:hypothetical protein
MRDNLYRVIVVTLLVCIAVALAVRRYGVPDRSDRPDRFEGFHQVAIARPGWSLGYRMGMQQHLVIRDARTWATVWQQNAGIGEPLPDVPVVDFTRDVVIVAALGWRHGSGYSIDITEVRVGGGDAVVFLEERDPGPSCPGLAVETAPAAFAIVPSFPGLAMFVDHPVHRCY